MTFFNPITFENIDKARRLLADLRYDENRLVEKELYNELEQKIKEYEEFVEKDTESAMKVK